VTQLENLAEVIKREKEERAAIKDNLKNFHTAVNARESEINAELEKKHQQRMEELENQAAFLQSLIQKK
jgi:hypothetical protein